MPTMQAEASIREGTLNGSPTTCWAQHKRCAARPRCWWATGRRLEGAGIVTAEKRMGDALFDFGARFVVP